MQQWIFRLQISFVRPQTVGQTPIIMKTKSSRTSFMIFSSIIFIEKISIIIFLCWCIVLWAAGTSEWGVTLWRTLVLWKVGRQTASCGGTVTSVLLPWRWLFPSPWQWNFCGRFLPLVLVSSALTSSSTRKFSKNILGKLGFFLKVIENSQWSVSLFQSNSLGV